MGNLYAITLMSVCWTVTGVGRELPAGQALSHGMRVTMKCKTRAAAPLANTQENKMQFLEWG